MGELCIEGVLGLALALVLLGSVAVVSVGEFKRVVCFSVYVSGESRKICADVLILVSELIEKPLLSTYQTKCES